MKVLSVVLVVGLALVACGSGDKDLPAAVCITEGTETKAPEYIGLSEQEAEDLAAEQGLELREVGRDGECFPATMDYREDRINVEYADGVVVGAAIF